ncbi:MULTISPECIES: tetratricopeptide repeat protein [Rhodanobacter]|uniref:Tetratricopeptide repeat protein n=1 Tax=Rhodanobacter hydrolyticus TaxID=2250595 RepID=A0ABW8J4Y5_9GAMM|nr:tetratricopeptide repeat protein [Rhodanobacter sp. 7MK24]MBD8878977.1 tetratricopeptide repeat protein [Rhodanobacter sp. 7MK24]
MATVLRSTRAWCLPLAAVLLASCATEAPVEAPRHPAVSPASMVAAIRAAGDREQSVIAVQPLADPGISAWQQAAEASVQAGHYDTAAATLDQAIKQSPNSPDLLQDRAEVAIYQHDYDMAQKLAQHSWTVGPKFGPLCARNWETIAQLRKEAGDDTGFDTAEKWLPKCHVQGVNRF